MNGAGAGGRLVASRRNQYTSNQTTRQKRNTFRETGMFRGDYRNSTEARAANSRRGRGSASQLGGRDQRYRDLMYAFAAW